MAATNFSSNFTTNSVTAPRGRWASFRAEQFGYSPAILKHNARGFYVEFFVCHPDSGMSTRFRRNLNILRARMSYGDFLRQAHTICSNINARLATGWTPFAEDGNSLRYTPIHDALYTYLDRKSPRQVWVRVLVKQLFQYLLGFRPNLSKQPGHF